MTELAESGNVPNPVSRDICYDRNGVCIKQKNCAVARHEIDDRTGRNVYLLTFNLNTGTLLDPNNDSPVHDTKWLMVSAECFRMYLNFLITKNPIHFSRASGKIHENV